MGPRGYVAASFASISAAALVRAYLGYLTGNAVLVVEGMHAALDVAITGMVLASMALVRSPYAKRFPYGLYKVEDLATLGLAALLAAAAASMANEVLAIPSEASILPAAAQAASLPGVVLSAMFKIKAGDELGSPALRADGIHTVGDAIEGGCVAAGLFAYAVSGASIAYAAAGAAAVTGLAVAAYEAGKDSLLSLLDLPRDKEFVERVKRKFEEAAGVLRVVEAKARWAGPVVFVELTVRAPPLCTVEDTYLAVKHGVARVKTAEKAVEDVVVSVLPAARERFRLCVPQDEKGWDKPASTHFGRARHFAIVEIDRGRVLGVEYAEIQPARGEGPLPHGARVAEELYRLGVTDVAVVNIGEIAYSLLLRHGILVWRAEPGMPLREIAEAMASMSLERLKEPTHEAPWTKRPV